MKGIRHAAAAAVAALLALGFGTAIAQGRLTPDEAGREVAERFGVDVLDVRETQMDGRTVYVVTTMNPGGNDNAAFKVTRLMIDPESGNLVSQVRPGPTGYVLPESGSGIATGRTDGRDIRRMSLGTP